jgi:hypothetical protein
MSSRAADDFAAIRHRLRELRGEVSMPENTATERYPRHVMDAAIQLLHELAERDRY